MSAVLEAVALNKAYHGLEVIKNLSLAIAPGERVALIGPNGAGKTTLVDLLTGVTSPCSGEVLLKGRIVNHIGVAGRVQRGLARSFQITRLFREMTVAENVGLAVLQRRGMAGRLVGGLNSIPGVRDEVTQLLQRFAIVTLKDCRVGEIAYGQQRLVEIAIALAINPDVLLLDEPAAGLPGADVARIERILEDLPPHLAILMVDHDIELVFRFARRVIVLAGGSLIFDGSPDDARRNPDVRKAYLGSYADAGSFG